MRAARQSPSEDTNLMVLRRVIPPMGACRLTLPAGSPPGHKRCGPIPAGSVSGVRGRLNLRGGCVVAAGWPMSRPWLPRPRHRPVDHNGAGVVCGASRFSILV